MPKTVLMWNFILRTMRGIDIFQKLSLEKLPRSYVGTFYAGPPVLTYLGTTSCLKTQIFLIKSLNLCKKVKRKFLNIMCTMCLEFEIKAELSLWFCTYFGGNIFELLIPLYYY